ncbi:hypothetical protein D3C71_1325940 [compost metagenome]
MAGGEYNQLVGVAGRGGRQHADDVYLPRLLFVCVAADGAIGGQRLAVPEGLAGGAHRDAQCTVSRVVCGRRRQAPTQPVRAAPLHQFALVGRLPLQCRRWRGGQCAISIQRGGCHLLGLVVVHARWGRDQQQPRGDRDEQDGEGGQGAWDLHGPIVSVARSHWTPAWSCSADGRSPVALGEGMLAA